NGLPAEPAVDEARRVMIQRDVVIELRIVHQYEGVVRLAVGAIEAVQREPSPEPDSPPPVPMPAWPSVDTPLLWAACRPSASADAFRLSFSAGVSTGGRSDGCRLPNPLKGAIRPRLCYRRQHRADASEG